MDKAKNHHQKSETSLAPLISPSLKLKTKKFYSSISNLNISNISNISSSPNSICSFSLPHMTLKPINRKSSDNHSVFPQWLLERHDFKTKLLDKPYEVDISKICSKPYKLRDSYENNELISWCRSCVFFKSFSDYACNEVCSKLLSQEFSPGQALINEGEVADRMFIIWKGRVGIYKQGMNGCLNVLGSKNVIGETALEANCLRTASVIAIDKVITLKLMKEDYLVSIFRQKHKQRVTVVSLLKTIPFFQDLLSARLETFAWNMLFIHYDKNNAVYLEGQDTTGLYFVKEGSVQLLAHVTVIDKKSIPTTHTGKEMLVQKKTYELPVKTVLQGDFFGENEVFANRKRKYKAVCKENSEILLLKKETIFEMLGEKELEIVANLHEKLKSKKTLVKELRKKISAKKRSYKAVLDAHCAAPVPQGRLEIDRKMKRKTQLAKSALFKFNKELNESLLVEECFYQK